MRDLSHKIGTTLQPVFISKKLEQDLKPKEIKPPIVNQQCVVYLFSCDLCDADYVGYTARHLEHKNSAIGKHLSGPAQQDFEWGGSSVSQIFFWGGGGEGGGGMLPWEN